MRKGLNCRHIETTLDVLGSQQQNAWEFCKKFMLDGVVIVSALSAGIFVRRLNAFRVQVTSRFRKINLLSKHVPINQKVLMERSS